LQQVRFFRDRLDIISVVVRRVRVRSCKNIKVHLTIGDTECVKMDGNGIAQFPSGNLVVLVLDICSKSDAPVTRVRLTPNSQSVVVRGAMRGSKSCEPGPSMVLGRGTLLDRSVGSYRQL
jgi:hypothetical protein